MICAIEFEFTGFFLFESVENTVLVRQDTWPEIAPGKKF